MPREISALALVGKLPAAMIGPVSNTAVTEREQPPVDQFVLVAIYRTDPVVGWLGITGTHADHLALMNQQGAGVKLVSRGVRDTFQPDCMVECYELQKSNGSTGVAVSTPPAASGPAIDPMTCLPIP